MGFLCHCEDENVIFSVSFFFLLPFFFSFFLKGSAFLLGLLGSISYNHSSFNTFLHFK